MASSREILRALRRIGYTIQPARGKGSHIVAYFNQAKKACVTIAQMAHDIPKGTLASIGGAIGLTEHGEFEKFTRGELTPEEYISILLRQGIVERKHDQE